MKKPAPPGIEFIFLSILFLIITVSVLIAFGIARLMTNLLDVRIRLKGVVSIAMLSLLCFSMSSLVLWGREDGVTLYRLGHAQGYEGALLFYGFPVRWYCMFEPYDTSARNLFLLPSNWYFDGLFIDFALWLVLSVTLVYLVRFSLLKMRARQAKT